ncbi:MAG TPA: transcriptional repressor LexA [Ktedonobacteraceae bacterium]|jgi:repressor LexA|nr:transcriptional repressor LexA [Ktedonobacteraceae bacterium]
MSSEQASDIQRRIYDFIVAYMREEGMPPTNREIGQAMKIASTGHVDYHLSMLEKKNYIQREPKKSRGIKLVQQQPVGIPIMGAIAAGLPIESAPEHGQVLDAGRELEQQNTYALVVKGNSMIEDHICDGDYVVIKPQLSCQNGDIVVAVHLLEENKSSATLKRFFQEQDQVRLQPANSSMDPIYVSKREWDTEWQVQGKVVAIFRQYHAA